MEIAILLGMIAFLWIILTLMIWGMLRQRKKYKTLRSIYMNGDSEHYAAPASIQEWERLAQASLAASRERRRNGAH